MKTNKHKIIIFVIIALSVIMSGKVFAYPNKSYTPYTVDGSLYCGEHGASLYLDVDGGSVSEINYGGGSSEAMDIAVAYAQYLGLNGSSMQNVIWSTSNNKGQHAELSNERVKKYKTVYDTIFSKASKDIIVSKTDENNLKVLVDQISGTYTVGPYKLGLSVGKGTQAANILYQEITNNYAGKFAWYNGVTMANAESLELVDLNGKKITMPNFNTEQEFYIKFKPKNAGAIVETSQPVFDFSFLKSVSGNLTRYRATSVNYNITIDKKDVISAAKFSGNQSGHNDTWSETKEVTIEKKITNHNSKTVATVSQKYEVKRKYVYENGIYDRSETSITSGDLNLSGTATVTHSDGSYINNVQDLVRVPGGPSTTPWRGGAGVETEITSHGTTLASVAIDMQIGGTVWLEAEELKTGNYNGRYKATKTDNDSPFAGIQVDLYESNGTLVATTTTDKNGKYRFYGQVSEGKALINPLKKYYVVFEYDGQSYQSTYYRNDISKPGGFSNAREEEKERDKTYNAKFKTIYSDPGNYGENKRAYASDHKIQKDDGTYATTGEKNEEGKEIALTYEDVYNKFLELATASNAGEPKAGDNKKTWTNNSYTSILNDANGLKKWLSAKGVNKEYESIKSFILDSLMQSSTQKDETGKTVLYPKYDRFVVKDLYNTNSAEYKKATTTTFKLGNTYTYLYSINYDMARYVDFGLCNRVQADIRLQKDVYKTTLIVNGKQEEYMYSQRDLSANPNNNNWDIRVRASDSLYNGTKAYDRDIRASEYLVGEENVGANKTLQAYVTYRIAFKNVGDVNVKVKEIVDYYDADGYTFDSANPYISANTFIGDYAGNKTKDVTASNTGLKNRTRTEANKLKADGYSYNELYLTGMDDILTPGNVSWVYVTFKVNNDDKGKVKLDYTTDPYTTNKDELQVSVGKKNIAEISAYETYYARSGEGITEIPNYLKPVKNKNGKITDYQLVNTDVAGKVAGLIDNDSNPGSLSKLDLDANGNLKVEKTTKTIEGKAGIVASDRQEDDTSQAPNIRLIIDNDESDIRRLSGFVYDDKRTENNDSTGNATIGNGQYDDGETKVNGVKVELVELISEVNAIGVSTHNYTTAEKVWQSYTYDASKNELVETDKDRYSSGDGRAKIVINGPKGTIFEVSDNEKLEYNDGYYTFKSIPAGDFYIRFTYGDDDSTVLTSGDNDVNKLLGATGRNAISYNGQDYKSTVYQKGIDQSGSYYDINGYTNYAGQNYTLNGNVLNNGTDKASMYYYNINASKASATVSDAKDVWYYRTNSNNYSKGKDGTTLLNKRAETLASFEQLASFAPSADEITYYSYDYENDGGKIYDYYNTAMDYFKNQQRAMVDALKANTYMVAQTGVINTEIEMSRNSTQYDLNNKDTKTLDYTIDNINLGLTERPKAQLKLNKEVANYNLTLQNGQVIFDAQQSVNNLSYSGHNEHSAEKENGLFKDGEPRVGRPGNGNSELIQNYVDNEMLANATVNVIYKLSVENVGETDYTDEEFYYTGKENNKGENISKTQASRVVDYVSNSIKFEQTNQTQWNLSSANELIPSKDASNEDSNYVNRLFNPELTTYTTVLTTDALNGELKPGDKKETTLRLSTQTSANNAENNLVYNNMAEIIATTNDVGRRCVYSIPGNEEMADQSLGQNAASGTITSMDRIQVSEIDADSAQRIVLMPPTGEEVNSTKSSVGLTLLASITLAAVAGIKNLLIK